MKNESQTQYFKKADMGRRIFQYRKKKGILQKTLAKEVGISSNYLSEIERGVGKSISFKNLILISIALDVTIDDLLIDSLSCFNKVPTNDLFQAILFETDSFTEEQLDFFMKIVQVFKTK